MSIGSSPSAVLVLTEKDSHRISFYDTTSGEQLASVALPDFPHEFVVDAGRRYAYAGHYGVRTSGDDGEGGASVMIVDLLARRLVGTIDCSPYRRLHGIAIDRCDRLHVLSEAANVLLRFERPRDGEAPIVVPSGGIKSHLFALAADGEWAYCSNLASQTVTRISPANPSVPPLAVAPGEKPEGLLLSADGRLLYVSNRNSDTLTAIETATMSVVASAPSRRDPARICRMRDGRLLIMHYDGRSISVVDPVTLAEIAHLPLAARPAAACIDPRTGHAFISVDSNQSLEIDLATMRIVAAIDTGREPDCCVVLSVN